MLPVTLVAFMSACHKWSTVQEDPRDFVGQDDVHRVRVERRSGDVIELADPVVRGDTLVGSHDGVEVAILIADVRELDYRTFDGLGTGILIGSVVIVGLAIVAVGMYAAWDCCL
jgi:hypothetical protein